MSKSNTDGPDGEQGKAWWFLDQLVVEHPSSPEAKTVVLEMTLPVGSSAPLHIHDDLDDAGTSSKEKWSCVAVMK